MKDYWIVWNNAKSEGVVFDNEADARMTAEGYEAMQRAMVRGAMVPCIGEALAEYQDNPMSVQKVSL
jgi:hypothetical protein